MTDPENQMNLILEKTGIPLKVVWLPSDNAKEHARIIMEEGLVMVYDEDEAEALNSLFHEILEYRIRKVTGPYRALMNKLIEFVEAEVYAQKEKALAEIMNDFCVWKELRNSPAPTDNRGRKNEQSHS